MNYITVKTPDVRKPDPKPFEPALPPEILNAANPMLALAIAEGKAPRHPGVATQTKGKTYSDLTPGTLYRRVFDALVKRGEATSRELAGDAGETVLNKATVGKIASVLRKLRSDGLVEIRGERREGFTTRKLWVVTEGRGKADA